MNNLEVKSVDFLGDTLQAAKDQDGIVWVGVSYICNGIGFSKSQKDTQIQNIQKDYVLSGGCLKFQAGVFDPNNSTIGLQLDYVPLWLAKISITPNMQEENPTLVDKLVKYQLKAKDVLAAAFLPTARPMTQAEIIAAQAQVMVEIERRQALNDEKMACIETNVDNISEIIALNPNSWRQDAKHLVGKIVSKLGGFDCYKEVNKSIYDLVDARAGVNLETRLTNKRRRMADEGTSKSKRDKLNKLDVIAEDKRLVEIYIAILKEMAIKHKIA